MQMNADGGAAESNGIASHLGHSIRPCHRTPLSSRESYREICFCCECTAESLPFLSHPFGFFCTGGLKRRCSRVPGSKSEIKGNIASEQYSVTQKRDSALTFCLPNLSGVILALKKLQ